MRLATFLIGSRPIVCQALAIPRAWAPIAGLKNHEWEVDVPSSLARAVCAFALLCLGGATAQASEEGGAESPGREPAVIRGRVLDAGTAEPVAAANVRLIDTRLGAATDQDGDFVIGNVTPGTYSLRASRVGYADTIHTGIRVGGTTDVEVELLMRPSVLELSKVTVTPGSFSFMDGSSTRQTMSRDDIESVPQFGEDIFRAVNRLPGLSSGDYSAHFSIRGGRHDETLIILDGLEIYEPYHMKDFNEGAISIVDAQTIEGVELMTGGFPAAYGNKRSGVFKLTSRQPVPDSGTKHSVGLSFINARGMSAGTFAKDKGSWFVSARRGYLDLVLDIMNQNDLPSPTYYDVFSKVTYEIDPRHGLAFNVLHAGDRYEFHSEATTGFQDTIKTTESAQNRYGNSYVWLTLVSDLTPRLAVTTMASAGVVTKHRDGDESYVDIVYSQYDLRSRRDFTIFGLKQDWLYEHSARAFFEYGFDLRRLDTDYTFDSLVGQDPNDPTADPDGHYPVRTSAATSESGVTLGAHLTNRYRAVDPLTLELGLRYDRASYTGDSDLSPRANALFQITPRSSLRLGWGYYRQMHAIEDVASLDGSGEYYPSELSKQWTLGFEQSFASGARLRLEGYYKEGSNLRPRHRNWKGGIDTFPETNEDRILVHPQSSTSKGMEAYYTRDFGQKIALRGSYAYAVVEEVASRIDNINDPTPLVFQADHANPQDQRHALNIDCTYRPSRHWSINTSYAFHSGWPGTVQQMFEVTDSAGGADFVVRPVELYGSRLPAYHRGDVRATRRVSTARGDVRFFVELVNVTNHENIFGFDYEKAIDGNGQTYLVEEGETWFTILPSIGISWSKSL